MSLCLNPPPNTFFFFSPLRCMKAPSCCWVPACPVMAVCQRRRAWRSLSRAWRKWSGFWRSTRFNAQPSCLWKLRKSGRCLVWHYLTLSPLFLCPCQRCDVSKHRVLVASICPQSLPFFAVKFGVDITEAAHKLCGFLKSLGEQVGFIYHCLQRSCKIFAQY